jgi:hypothetical protein
MNPGRYIRALLKGRDEKIQAKCGNVERVILLFGATVPFKTLRRVEDLNQKVDELPNVLRKVMQGVRSSDLLPEPDSSKALENVQKRFGIKPDDMSLLESHMRLM